MKKNVGNLPQLININHICPFLSCIHELFDPVNKLLIFIVWWVNYPQFFKGNLERRKKNKYIHEYLDVSTAKVGPK